MGSNVTQQSKTAGPVLSGRTVAIPTEVAGLAYRLMQLDAGVYTLQLIKDDSGAQGIVGWRLDEGGVLEMPKHRRRKTNGQRRRRMDGDRALFIGEK